MANSLRRRRFQDPGGSSVRLIIHPPGSSHPASPALQFLGMAMMFPGLVGVLCSVLVAEVSYGLVNVEGDAQTGCVLRATIRLSLTIDRWPS